MFSFRNTFIVYSILILKLKQAICEIELITYYLMWSTNLCLCIYIKTKTINRLTQNLPIINLSYLFRLVKPSSDFVQAGCTKHLLSIKTNGLRLFRDRIAVYSINDFKP